MMLLTGSKKPETLQFYEKRGYNSSDKTAFIQWLGMEKFLISYVEEHPEVDLNTIIPNEENIKRILEAI